MKVLIKKKFYNGLVEVRDYEINNLISYNKSLKIIIDNPDLPEHDEYMILTANQLRKGRVINTQHSIYNNGQNYLLIGFKWKGKKVQKDEEVEINFDTRKRLSEMWKDVLAKKAI